MIWYLEVKYLCMWVKKHHICFLYIEGFFALKKQNEIKETTNKCTFVPFVTLIISFCEMISVNWYFDVRRLSRGVTKYHKHFRYTPLFFCLYSKIRYSDKKYKKRYAIKFFFSKVARPMFSYCTFWVPPLIPQYKKLSIRAIKDL